MKPTARRTRDLLREFPYAYHPNFQQAPFWIDDVQRGLIPGTAVELVAQWRALRGGPDEQFRLMKIKHALKELPDHPPMEWQPIESAPFDRDLEVAVLE